MDQEECRGHEQCQMTAKGKKRRWRVLFAFTARFFPVVLLSSHGIAQRMSALATPPQWQELERFQETITREEFVRLLHEVYAPGGAADGLIDVRSTSAIVHTTLTPDTTWSLLFAKDAASAKP